METNSISLKQVIDRIKMHPMLSKLPFETILIYTVEFFKLVGIPETYQEKLEVLEIKDYRAKLPSDFVDMIQVRSATIPPIYYRYGTDTFHTSKNKTFISPYTYKIQGGVIYTSEEKCKIEIAYRAMEVDECGLPLLPDDVNFTRALQAYVKLQHFTELCDMGKIDERTLDRADREYCWAVGACQSSFHNISLDKAESILNLARNIFTPNSLHQTGYSKSGDQGMLKIH